MSVPQSLEERIKKEAIYLVEKRATIRQTAKAFKLSKSLVHRDLNINLKQIDQKLYEEVRKVLDYNFSQRAVRGGEATKQKYKK